MHDHRSRESWDELEKLTSFAQAYNVVLGRPVSPPLSSLCGFDLIQVDESAAPRVVPVLVVAVAVRFISISRVRGIVCSWYGLIGPVVNGGQVLPSLD